MNQGYIFGLARAQRANADAIVAADAADARRDLDVAIHAHRIASIRVSRDRRRRVAAKADMTAMLKAIRKARKKGTLRCPEKIRK